MGDYETKQKQAYKVLYQWVINGEIDIVRFDSGFTAPELNMEYLKNQLADGGFD